ncbi:unnamed protein product [Tetraodon nigroviridis]|uniref:(spotted green pufferfish) hypothetical protein n=1 Tax=Tetraodon nigroviridis TaxID=99883 RepID=Q4RHI5_TETNG|nr:unnamed protein product [Tetraodon nigroviridis]
MAAALGPAPLCGAPAAASAGAPAVASAKSPPVKPSEARGTPDRRPQPCRDCYPPPPKKVRVEERGTKTKKLIRDGGVGGNGAGHVKEKVQQPAKSCSSGVGSRSVSPGKTSSSGSPPVPATGGPQPPSNTHKLFKQSHFFLHKAPSSSAKPKKATKDKLGEKEREKVKRDGMEKKKCKLSGAGSNVSHGSDFSKCENSLATKRENGEVTARHQGLRRGSMQAV